MHKQVLSCIVIAVFLAGENSFVLIEIFFIIKIVFLGCWYYWMVSLLKDKFIAVNNNKNNQFFN
jgi:hypothetical protein